MDSSEASGPRARRRVAANTIIQAAGDLGSKLATLGLYAVMARMVGRDDFGDFTSAVSLSLFVLIAGFGTDHTLTRRVAQRDDAVPATFWNAVLVRVVCGTGVSAIVLLVAVLGDYDSDVLVATAILSASALIDLVLFTEHGMFRGLEDAAPIAASNLLSRLTLAVVGSLVLLAGGSIVAVAIVWLAGSLLALAWASLRLRRMRLSLPLTASWSGSVSLVRDSFGLGLSAIFGGALSRLDVVMLGLMTTSGAVALYGAAYRLFESLFVITAALARSSFPALTRLTRQSTPTVGEATRLVLLVVAFVTVPVAALFALTPGPLIRMLYGPGFAAEETLRLLAPGVMFVGFFHVACFLLAAQGRQGVITAGLIAGTATNVGLNLLLIPEMAEQGAAVAMTAAMAVTSAVLFVAVLQVTGRIALHRVLAGPLVGAGAMALTTVLVGTGGAGLALAVPAYVIVLVGFERAVFPQDLKALVRSLRRRSDGA